MIRTNSGNVSEGWYWRAETNSTTLLGILNTDIEEAGVAVWLDYYLDGVKRQYNLPEIAIPGGVAELVDIGAVIAAGVPDKDGDVIPPSVTTGGYGLRKAGPNFTSPITTEALVIDRRRKSFLTFYNTCCAYFNFTLFPRDIVGVVGSTQNLTTTAINSCTYAPVVLTFNSFYWPDNGAVADISGPAQLSLVGPGSTTVHASVNFCLPPSGPKSFWEPCIPAAASDSSTVTVKPTVTEVSGADRVPLRASGSSGPNSIQLTATGNPPGGSFQWSTTSSRISLSNQNSPTVTVTSVTASSARNDVPVTVTYTVNNVASNPVTVNITVVKPASLQLISDTTDPDGHICDPSAPENNCDKSKFTGGGVYNSYKRELQYRIMDHLDPPEWIAGFALAVTESFTPPTGTCIDEGAQVVTGTGFGDTIPDCFYFCAENCRIGGSCSPSSTQTIKANGFTVATKNVNWKCSGVTVQ